MTSIACCIRSMSCLANSCVLFFVTAYMRFHYMTIVQIENISSPMLQGIDFCIGEHKVISHLFGLVQTIEDLIFLLCDP
ncbi:hypothetical protein SETIT_4G268400v2 [Setaria italica]|uniref:Uncharacterized protein n=2 Tax=Setaria italica TaxID=4555 RepID=A0A368QZ02_SETIT|nr:hypothetical protein SETIT_4G268400v2 [Setaria italica]